FDLLATIGPYQYAELELRGLRLRFPYMPGTLCALSGYVIKHSVLPSDGERVCYTYFMEDRVLCRLGVPTAPPVRVDRFGACHT
ncbi:hypothetical protein JAAARDRAFT_143593, partial [Jaapia argillacea MUCL 33604]